MPTATAPLSTPSADTPDDAPIVLTRRRIDKLLVGFGAVITVALLVVGGLLFWGATFSRNYVTDELASQNITFPSAEELRAEGRDDLVRYAGLQLTTGSQAEAYASYINGHLEAIADGQTYSQIDDRGAAEAVRQAEARGAPADEVAQLQAKATQLRTQRDTLFRGETLRGLLLSSYAWATVGNIAMIAAWAVIGAALVMAVLTVVGAARVRREA